MSIAKTVSNLAEQFQMLVEENRPNVAIAKGVEPKLRIFLYSYDDEGDGPTRSFEEDDEDKDISFSHEIRNTSISRGFVRPKQEENTKQGNLMYHLADYKTEMELKNASPLLKCMDFHMTLTGVAKRWYLKLKPGSIQSWPQLKIAFMSVFVGHTLGEAPRTKLNDIRQGLSESVKSYFNKF
ncbi:Uncharacterized protein Adt_35744 [Abeliophyllum distichum]|uniref:Retrotransposon gag domain-containing protein n=1 Tax=Abeliophyllum distichum TaxID=126358 RepID=A0ABD1QFL6_9LAMI